MSRLPAPTVRDELSRAPSSALRVLFLINDLRTGGAERSLVNFVNHMQGVRPAVVLVEPAAGSLLGELDATVEVFSLQQRPAPGQFLLEIPRLVQSAYRLARIARATDAQVVSAFLNRSHTIALLAKLLFAPRLRVVINAHGMLSDHVDLDFAAAERPFVRAFIAYAFRRADRIIAVSVGVRDDLVQRFSIPMERITVVENPIDLQRIRRASEEEVDDVRAAGAFHMIVGVGRLVRLKGFDVLLHAIARLPRTLRTKLFIIGEGQERPTLERLMAELNIADRVTLLGAQSNPWKYMARADVLAVPSRTEAFPNVIGEALALSVPVVAARCSEGVADYLEGGRCGVLVPPEDVGALADALERVLTDEDLRCQLARRGTERAASFDLPLVVPRYERFISEVAQG